MSRSPGRMSSYRRNFEDSSSLSYQVRESSPSPIRRDTRRAFFGYSCRTGASSSLRGESVGRRTISGARRTRMSGAGASAGSLVCVGPHGERPVDLNVAAAENQAFLNTRTCERQEMVVLNDRLAAYIEKVRSLEQQNKSLEAETEAYRHRFQRSTGLRLLYEEQLKELKKIADQMRVQRDISLEAKNATTAQLEAIKIKSDEAVELRRKAELAIEALRTDVDKATSSRIVMEKKQEQLEVDIEFRKRVQQQEIDELMKQMYTAHVSVRTTFTLPDLAAAVKQIQTQYDDIAAKNLQEMDSWYKNKFEDLTNKSSRHVDKTRSTREEVSRAKKDIQSKERDLETLTTRNEALEAKIREVQEKYRKELEDLQARIEALQLELKSTKEKIALRLREYQDLLHVKMSLEMEITTYRKLVEGEDLRLSGMMTLSLTGCGMSAVGGVSFGGGGMGGIGGGRGGVIGDSGGGVGGMGRAAGIGESVGPGGMGGRMGAGGPVDKGPAGRAGGPGVGGGRGFEAGDEGGVRAVAGVVGPGGDVGAPGMSGVGSGAGRFGDHIGELDTDAGGVGTAGLGTGDGGVYGGMGPASMGSRIRGSGGTKVAGGGDVGIGGMGKVGGERGGPVVITMGHGSNGHDPNNDNYMQAVELTERRTVLIR